MLQLVILMSKSIKQISSLYLWNSIYFDGIKTLIQHNNHWKNIIKMKYHLLKTMHLAPRSTLDVKQDISFSHRPSAMFCLYIIESGIDKRWWSTWKHNFSFSHRPSAKFAYSWVRHWQSPMVELETQYYCRNKNE